MNRMRFVCLLGLLGVLACGSIAQAQTACPPGMIPYGTAQNQSVCGADPNAQQQGPGQSAAPSVRWASNWQALATDTPKGILGISKDEPNRALAEVAALRDCRAKGGTDCTLQISYGNGCVAMVVGDRLMNMNGGITEDDATQKGLKMCRGAGDANCHVYYSACSLPQRIQ
ncbi:DUF4189 domain-containing protein (plasmid) [Ralstonia solanacearum]|nr:DUF4189 domain-containing protein [Ralstonia solanacearum]